MNMPLYLCVSVCPTAYLQSNLHRFFLHVIYDRGSIIVIRYVLPVSCMTSSSHILARNVCDAKKVYPAGGRADLCTAIDPPERPRAAPNRGRRLMSTSALVLWRVATGAGGARRRVGGWSASELRRPPARAVRRRGRARGDATGAGRRARPATLHRRRRPPPGRPLHRRAVHPGRQHRHRQPLVGRSRPGRLGRRRRRLPPRALPAIRARDHAFPARRRTRSGRTWFVGGRRPTDGVVLPVQLRRAAVRRRVARPASDLHLLRDHHALVSAGGGRRPAGSRRRRDIRRRRSTGAVPDTHHAQITSRLVDSTRKVNASAYRSIGRYRLSKTSLKLRCVSEKRHPSIFV